MQKKSQKTVFTAGALAVCLACLVIVVRAQEQTPPPAASGSTPKMAEDVYKNIKVFKGVPADQIMPAMHFMSTSLGVGCEFCHDEKAYEKDTKDTKDAARHMVEMQNGINKEFFRGRLQVSCNSCHNGEPEPSRIPTLAEGAPKAPSANPPVRPSYDQVVAKYVQAVGGSESLGKLSSLVEKGTVTLQEGPQFPLEITIKAPDKAITVAHTPKGNYVEDYDGQTGWLADPGQPVRQLSGSELDPLKFAADPQYIEHLKQNFPRTMARPSKIGDQEAIGIMGAKPGRAPQQFLLDPNTGLLLRSMFFFDSPIGMNPERIEYSDYRDVHGVKIAFQRKITGPNGRYTIQIDSIQANVPIDDTKFAKPEAPAASVSSPSAKP